MLFRALKFGIAASLVWQTATLAQVPGASRPPVPADPLELVTIYAQPIQDAERAAAALFQTPVCKRLVQAR